MYKTINFSDFTDQFNKVRPDNFSYNGLKVLFDYFESMDNIELDVIAICCNFTECTIKDALHDYGLESIEELEENTTVLKIDNDNIIYQNY